MKTLVVPPTKAEEMKKVRVFSKSHSRYAECTLSALNTAKESNSSLQINFSTTYSEDGKRRLSREGSSLVKFNDLII